MREHIITSAQWGMVAAFMGIMAQVLLKADFLLKLGILALLLNIVWVLGYWASWLVSKDV